FSTVEVARLWLGFVGNLRERVPDLSSCLLLSVFPQLLIVIYFTALQPYTGSGFIHPAERTISAIYLLLLTLQVFYICRAAQRIISVQSARFFLTAPLSDDHEPGPETRDIVREDSKVHALGVDIKRAETLHGQHALMLG
ncbi:hypothetical protein BC832DRAFT_529244, partial [Gaertneriomyces semiglobifer]